MTKVLLAEDDQTMVNLLKTLLHMDGFEVIAVDADEDVPAAISRHQADILVLDVHLSNQNGLDVLDTIRTTDREHKVRVIMISGLNLKEDCLRRGADDFLMKPFMPDDLFKMLRKNIKPV
jgi:DNA-binding response OmpR family regulator